MDERGLEQRGGRGDRFPIGHEPFKGGKRLKEEEEEEWTGLAI